MTRCSTCVPCASRPKARVSKASSSCAWPTRAAAVNWPWRCPAPAAQLKGRIAPAQGAGELQRSIGDAAALQAWIEKLPGLSAAFQGAAAQGAAQLDARWDGGWQAVQRRLQNFGQPSHAAPSPRTGHARPARLDLRLPGGDTAPPPPIQLRAVHAELAGSLAQATLRLQGQARPARASSRSTRARAAAWTGRANGA